MPDYNSTRPEITAIPSGIKLEWCFGPLEGDEAKAEAGAHL